MSDSNLDLDDALRRLLVTEPPDDHLDSESLVAYHEGQMEPEQREVATEHLAACRECSERLLELARLGRPEVEPELAARLADDKDDDWRRLAARLDSDEVEKSATADRPPLELKIPPSPPAPVPAAGSRFVYALAAGLFVACLGFGAWVLALREQVASLLLPRANVEIVSLRPGDATRTRSTPAETIAHAGGVGKPLVLILNPTEPPRALPHRLEIRDPEGRLFGQVADLRPEPKVGTFHLTLPDSLLPPGTYTLSLYLEENLVAKFRLRLLGVD